MRLSLVIVALLGPAMLQVGLARADEGAVTMRWTAPAACPSGEAVREMLDARLPKDTPVHADAVVTNVAQGFRLVLRVQTTTARGERTLEARDCKTLASSAVVIVAMAATQAREASASATPTPTPSPSPSPSLSSPGAASPPPTSETAPPARFLARPHADLDLGTLPAAAIGAGLAVGVDLPGALARARVELYGGLSLPQERKVTPVTGGAFDVRWLGVRACYFGLGGAPLRVGLCAGGEGSSVRGEAFGVTRPIAVSSRVFTLRADVAASMSVTRSDRFALQVSAGVAVPMARESFVIVPRAGADTIHERSAVSLRVTAGPELRF